LPLWQLEFDDGLGWDPDLLLRLGVETRPRLSLLFYQFPKSGQDEFAVLFDLFVGQGTERIEKHSSRLPRRRGSSIARSSLPSVRDRRRTAKGYGALFSQFSPPLW